MPIIPGPGPRTTEELALFDYFAGQALARLVANPTYANVPNGIDTEITA